MLHRLAVFVSDDLAVAVNQPLYPDRPQRLNVDFQRPLERRAHEVRRLRRMVGPLQIRPRQLVLLRVDNPVLQLLWLDLPALGVLRYPLVDFDERDFLVDERLVGFQLDCPENVERVGAFQRHNWAPAW